MTAYRRLLRGYDCSTPNFLLIATNSAVPSPRVCSRKGSHTHRRHRHPRCRLVDWNHDSTDTDAGLPGQSWKTPQSECDEVIASRRYRQDLCNMKDAFNYVSSITAPAIPTKRTLLVPLNRAHLGTPFFFEIASFVLDTAPQKRTGGRSSQN